MGVLTAGLQSVVRALLAPRRAPSWGRRGRWFRPAGGSRHSQRGIALLVVITTVMIMTIVVTDLSYAARVRFLSASHHRDRAQAEWLAKSGVNIYMLLFAASNELGSNEMIAEFGLSDSLWEMVPVFSTGLMRMLLGSGGDVDDIAEEDLQSFATDGIVDAELAEASREGGLFADRNFLDFDGDFSAEVWDHESRFNVNQLSTCGEVLTECAMAQMLYAILSGEENDQWFYDQNIDRWEIVGNLKDWIDTDSTRSAGSGGYEDSLYNTLDDPYLTKNAAFDTIAEIRLVDGWQGGVWERFGDKLTVYGKGKLNLTSIDTDMLVAAIQYSSGTTIPESTLTTIVEGIELEMALNPSMTGKQLRENIESTYGFELDSSFDDLFTDQSKTFTIESTGLVGTSAVKITAVVDFSKRSRGQLKYWRMD